VKVNKHRASTCAAKNRILRHQASGIRHQASGIGAWRGRGCRGQRTASSSNCAYFQPTFIGVVNQHCAPPLLFTMHFLKGLVLSLLPAAAIAAKKPAVDKFQHFHSKALSSSPLKLDDSIYGQLTSAPRDYSVAVLLTALESRFGCQLCREFQPEWDLLSKSWTKGDKKGESRLVFGTLDFTDGKDTFQSVSIRRTILLEHS
jgi:hypothetical protein